MAVPPDGQLHLALGQLYERQGQLDKAEETYKQGIVATPNRGRLYYHLVCVLLDRSDLDAARRTADSAMTRLRRNPWSYCALAELHLRAGSLLEARTLCRQGIRDCDVIVARLYELIIKTMDQEADTAGALEVCREWVSAIPLDGNSYTALAARLLERGDINEAREVVQKGLSQVPEWPPLLELAKRLM